MKLIDLYKKWMKAGKLPDSGLCFSVPEQYSEYLKLFHPTNEEKTEHKTPFLYWASEGDGGYSYFDFNPTRQTIVLLICAMCDEL